MENISIVQACRFNQNPFWWLFQTKTFHFTAYFHVFPSAVCMSFNNNHISPQHIIFCAGMISNDAQMDVGVCLCCGCTWALSASKTPFPPWWHRNFTTEGKHRTLPRPLCAAQSLRCSAKSIFSLAHCHFHFCQLPMTMLCLFAP